MFIGSPEIGGKLLPNSIIYGYTEIKHNGIIYRAHLYYQTKFSWYDWAYFKLDGYEQSIPARIMMTFDLKDTEITYKCESNTDGEYSSRTVQPIIHLTKKKWIIVLAAEGHESSNEDLTDNHVDSTIHIRINLHSDNDTWMISLTSLVAPCFVIYIQNYCEQDIYNRHADDRTAYVVNPVSISGDKLLASLL